MHFYHCEETGEVICRAFRAAAVISQCADGRFRRFAYVAGIPTRLDRS
jgi:hypothetical protein